MKLLMLKGLPASGKSTYARSLVDKSGNWVRINKDDLRAMLHNSKWSRSNEKQVLAIRDDIIRDAMLRQLNIIVDDTNFAPKHEQQLKHLAESNNYEFEVKFFDTPIQECIERDLKRPNSVGEKVIRGMYNQYLAPEPVKPYEAEDPTVPRAVICDIDGTLAHMDGRSPYDYSDKVLTDTLDETIAQLLDDLDEEVTVILVSGRKAECEKDTKKWLKRHNVRYDMLYMRETEDNRSDVIIKKEIFDKFIRNNYDIDFVLDDRNRVVDMWRNQLGLKVLQVAEGDF